MVTTLMTNKKHNKQGRPTRLNQIRKRHYLIGQAIYYLKKYGPLTSIQLCLLIDVKPRGLKQILISCPLIVFERQPYVYKYPPRENHGPKKHMIKRDIMVYRYIGG